jgi:hypothetical protein
MGWFLSQPIILVTMTLATSATVSGTFNPSCSFYQCPHCTEWRPGHPQHSCPKHYCTTPTPSPSTSAFSLNRSVGSSRKVTHRIPPPHCRGPYQQPYGTDAYAEDSDNDCNFTFNQGAEDNMVGDCRYGE